MFKCDICGHNFKNIPNLRKHRKTKHLHERATDRTEDNVFNYSKNALAMSYLFKDFLDARKHGDGQRVIRLYKFLLLYFKVDGRTKYAY